MGISTELITKNIQYMEHHHNAESHLDGGII